MPSYLVRFSLFLTAYYPLWLILTARAFDAFGLNAAAVVLALATVPLVLVALYLRYVQRKNPLPARAIQKVTRKDGEAMSYLITYVFPFVAFGAGDYIGVFSFVVILLVVMLLYMNSDMLHINPMLNLARWHIYELEMTDGEVVSLITRRRLRRGDMLHGVKMADEIYMETLTNGDNQ